jgi:anti-anti-sigma factor
VLDIPIVNSEQFQIATQPAGGGVLRVRLAGEFDMSVGSALSDALVEAVRAPGVTWVVVDLERTVFLDSHGVASLVAGFDEAVRAGRRFTVTRARGTVKHVLEITGLDEVLVDDDEPLATE